VAGRTHTVEHSRLRGRLLHVKLSAIDDRTAAEPLGQHYLQVPEGELEPLEDDRYYRFQLIGLSVRSVSGEPLGRVVSVETTPSNDLFVVQGPRGEILVPAIDDIVKEIDVQGGLMTIEVVPGLIPPERKHRRRP
jgi:16S rRNA processing protein RimM